MRDRIQINAPAVIQKRHLTLTKLFADFVDSEVELVKLATRLRSFLPGTFAEKDQDDVDSVGEDDADGKELAGTTSKISISTSSSSSSKISDCKAEG